MFNQFYIGALKKYADFKGVATRQEFWMFVLFNFLVALGVGIVAGLVKLPLLIGLYQLAMIIPGLAIGARRLHDIGKSGWMLLLGLIPLVGPIVLIIFFVQPTKNNTAA